MTDSTALPPTSGPSPSSLRSRMSHIPHVAETVSGPAQPSRLRVTAEIADIIGGGWLGLRENRIERERAQHLEDLEKARRIRSEAIEQARAQRRAEIIEDRNRREERFQQMHQLRGSIIHHETKRRAPRGPSEEGSSGGANIDLSELISVQKETVMAISSMTDKLGAIYAILSDMRSLNRNEKYSRGVNIGDGNSGSVNIPPAIPIPTAAPVATAAGGDGSSIASTLGGVAAGAAGGAAASRVATGLAGRMGAARLATTVLPRLGVAGALAGAALTLGPMAGEAARAEYERRRAEHPENFEPRPQTPEEHESARIPPGTTNPPNRIYQPLPDPVTFLSREEDEGERRRLAPRAAAARDRWVGSATEARRAIEAAHSARRIDNVRRRELLVALQTGSMNPAAIIASLNTPTPTPVTPPTTSTPTPASAVITEPRPAQVAPVETQPVPPPLTPVTPPVSNNTPTILGSIGGLKEGATAAEKLTPGSTPTGVGARTSAQRASGPANWQEGMLVPGSRSDLPAGQRLSEEQAAVAAEGSVERRLMDLLGRTEGTDRRRGYNETLANGRFTGGDVDLTSMTLRQIQELQAQMLRHPENRWNSSALGRYQIVGDTLSGRRLPNGQREGGLIRQLNLDPDTTYFTPEIQDRMARQLMHSRGLGRFQRGQITQEQLLDNFAQEWASFPNRNGIGHYPNQPVAHATTDEVIERLTPRQPGAGVAAARPNTLPTANTAAGPRNALLAMGTNDFSNPEVAYRETLAAIEEARQRGLSPTVVPPNANSDRFRAVSEAVTRAATEAGVRIENGTYSDRDPLHLTPQSAREIAGRNQGSIAIGDSNAVRLGQALGMRTSRDGREILDPNGNVIARVGAGSAAITGNIRQLPRLQAPAANTAPATAVAPTSDRIPDAVLRLPSGDQSAEIIDRPGADEPYRRINGFAVNDSSNRIVMASMDDQRRDEPPRTGDLPVGTHVDPYNVPNVRPERHALEILFGYPLA